MGKNKENLTGGKRYGMLCEQNTVTVNRPVECFMINHIIAQVNDFVHAL